MRYGDKRDYPKISIFVRKPGAADFEYFCSTTWARTCADAKARAADLIARSFRDMPEIKAVRT
jgi:hypothetical protein